MIEMIQSSFKLILKNEFGLNIMIEMIQSSFKIILKKWVRVEHHDRNDSVFIQTHSKRMSSGWTSW